MIESERPDRERPDHERPGRECSGHERRRRERRHRGRPSVVAVPARDEADRIGSCLRALLDQRDLSGARLARRALQIVVVANNCRDRTAEVARSFGDAVTVIELNLPPSHAHAGAARRTAMDAAVQQMADHADGMVCTTDADSRPRPDWIAQLWKSLDAGAQAVAGAVDLDPREPDPMIPAARAQEARYSALQAEVNARLDPEPHNPWPNHIWSWGANLAVTASAYRRVGGLPAAPLAEDRAFVEALRLRDVPVRHCLEARVWTSPRRDGRAAGGLASLIDAHVQGDQEPCDAALEPIAAAYRRAAWRARLRAAFQTGQIAQVSAAWAARLRMSADALASSFAPDSFGAAWASIEAQSPRLARRRLQVSELEGEIRRGERLLARLRPNGSADPGDSARVAAAGLWSAPAPPPT